MPDAIPPIPAPGDEHPFAQYVRILGKGKAGTRSLSEEEAEAAFGMILRGETVPLQLGAFLMLLRVKEETGEELAGFVRACREEMAKPPKGLQADLDWSCYAGKKHQHPWFILSLMLLAQAGYRVLVHGADGHTPGRLYTELAMRELGLPVASAWHDVSDQLALENLSYLPLRLLCPPLHDMMQYRPLLGLRSPVNTLARMLNPLRAACSIQSIFHPAYADLHQRADLLLGQQSAMVFKGESGEVEIKPQANTRIHLLREGDSTELNMARSRSDRVTAVASPASAPLRRLWRGEAEDAYGLEATLATTTAALMLLDATLDMPSARARAEELWAERARSRLN